MPDQSKHTECNTLVQGNTNKHIYKLQTDTIDKNKAKLICLLHTYNITKLNKCKQSTITSNLAKQQHENIDIYSY